MAKERYNRPGQKPDNPAGVSDMALRQLTMSGLNDPLLGDPSGPPRTLEQLLAIWEQPGLARLVDKWFRDPDATGYEAWQPGPEPRQAGPFALPPWMECYLLAQDLNKMEIPRDVAPIPMDVIPGWAQRTPRSYPLQGGAEAEHNAAIIEQFPAVAARDPLTSGIIARLVLEHLWPANWERLDNDQLRAARLEMAAEVA